MIPMFGFFRFRVWDRRRTRILQVGIAPNKVTDEGLELFLRHYFDGQAGANSVWFMSLIAATNYSGVSRDDTDASHAGWEEETRYSATTPFRAELDDENFTTGDTPPQVVCPILNPFDVYDSEEEQEITIKGFFVTTWEEIGGTGGKLWSTALVTPEIVAPPEGASVDVDYILRRGASP